MSIPSPQTRDEVATAIEILEAVVEVSRETIGRLVEENRRLKEYWGSYWNKSGNIGVDSGTQWCHYKGGIYTVLTLAKHSESEDILVIYRDSKAAVFARPLAMWFDEVSPGVPRFTLSLKDPVDT